MKQSTAPTLSEHLLREADKYLFYPERVRRTRSNLEAQKAFDKFFGILVEWRKTFAPSPQDQITKAINYRPESLNQFYCRDLLKEVPAIVERTRRLSHLTLSGISDSEFVYLREAANCYIFGLPQAAVALARAALEDCLRKKLVKSLPKSAVAEMDLKNLIDEVAKGRLSRERCTLAHRVRVAANDILHPDRLMTGPPDALGAIEAARTVILELSRR